MSTYRPTLADVRSCACGGVSKVIDTRLLDALTRRRECTLCGDICTTVEITVDDYWRYVRLRDGNALHIAAAYLVREADRRKGVVTPLPPFLASAMSAGTAETVQPAQGEARQRGGEAETPNG